jgi:hypothetical protein
MSDGEHEALSESLHTIRGAVALSSYRCPLMDRLYCDWQRVDAVTRLCHSTKGERTESVWLNFDPKEMPPSPATADERNMYLLDRPDTKRTRTHAKK